MQLHFSEPRAYSEIYTAGSKFTKDPYVVAQYDKYDSLSSFSVFYAAFGLDESTIGFCDPKEAKIRRDIISPLFSRRAILKLEGVIQDKVQTLRR